jgi:hypothetical protein
LEYHVCFTPTFSGKQLGRKTRAGVIYSLYSGNKPYFLVYDVAAMRWTDFFLRLLLLIQHREFECTAHSVNKAPVL